MPVIAVNGTELFYEITGESGPPLVLVHGAWSDHSFWDPVVPGFASTFRVITYDRRGHGQSQRNPANNGVMVDVDDLAALFATLNLGPVHLVGQSAGACVALHFALQHANRIIRMAGHEPPMIPILIDDPELTSAATQYKADMTRVHDLLSAGDHAPALRIMFGVVAGDPDLWDQLPPAAQQAMLTHADAFVSEAIDPDVQGVDLTALAEITTPTLLSFGAESPPLFAPVVARLAEALPNVSTHRFPDTGHGPMISHPDDYVATIRNFLLQQDAESA